MNSIFYHRVEIADGTGIIGEENKFFIEEVPVLDENDNYLVLKNAKFTVISKHKKDYETCLNVTSIGFNLADHIWGNRVTYIRYSLCRRKANLIRLDIEKEISKKFGFFNRVNLDVIKD